MAGGARAAGSAPNPTVPARTAPNPTVPARTAPNPTVPAPTAPTAPAGPVGDPVRRLMAEHRELCERAVDPLEIAAALEEAGHGAATAARCRHADLFALAEELYARVPRRPQADRPAADRPAEPPPGPARAPGSRAAAAGYAAGLAGLLLAPLAAPAGDPAAGAALALAAVLSLAPAHGAARWFRRVGRGHLGTAATLAEFRAGMRPVLPVAAALHLAALAVLSYAGLAVLTVLAPRPGPEPGGGLLHAATERAGATAWAAQGVLGLLLVLAVLLRGCDRPRTAAVTALAAPLLLAAARLAGLRPAGGLLGCGALAVVLSGCAWVLLGRAGSHR